jgi:hypothetical protein
MKFQVTLAPQDVTNFREKKLREVVLSRTTPERFELSFVLSEKDVEEERAPEASLGTRLPAYVAVEHINEAP